MKVTAIIDDKTIQEAVSHHSAAAPVTFSGQTEFVIPMLASLSARAPRLCDSAVNSCLVPRQKLGNK